LVGSKINVSVIVDSRDASVTDSGIVYGPPPTLKDVLGGEMITWADPTPADVVGTMGGCAAAPGSGGGGGGGVAIGGGGSGVGVGATG